MSKVFLSYSHSDEEFVMGLPGRLKLNGVECFFDSESIAGGDNWVLELEKRLDECDFFVPILTPAYVHSDWCQKERTAVMASLHPGKSKKIIPLLLKDCGDLLPPFLKNIQHIDISAEGEFEKNYPKICRQLGGVYVEEEEKTIDRTKLPPLCPLPAKHRMPHRSLGEHFAGRVKDLWKLDEGLGRCNTAVVQGVGLVVGMGGLGKTQLAVEYVHRFGRYFPGGVFWVEAEMGRMTMTAQVAEAAGIKLEREMDEKSQLAMLWQELSKERTLIVLDNFPEGEEIQAWLPPEKSIYTLVTSRRKDFFNYFCHDLNKLDHGEALTLLNSGGRSFEAEEAKPLIDALEGLPLALELVKHFLNLRPEISIKELLGQMEALEIFTEKYADQLPTGHSKQVAATFRMGWDLASEFEQQVLQTISLLAPAPVPRRVLRKILPAASESKLRDPLDEALSRLHVKLSLLELDGETDPRMHRLISAFVRSLTAEGEPLQKNVITAIRDEMARVENEKDTHSFRQLEKVLPHADFLLDSEVIEPQKAIDIADYMGWHHENLGRYRLGEKYQRKALDFAEKSHNPGNPIIAKQQSNLALVLMDLGEPEEARNLLQAALEAAKKSFAPGHPEIAKQQSNLALVLKDLGELEEARDLSRASLEADQKSFEPGHPDIAKKQSYLAMVLKDLGEREEAKELLTLAYHSLLEKLGPDHPTTKIVKGNLDSVRGQEKGKRGSEEERKSGKNNL